MKTDVEKTVASAAPDAAGTTDAGTTAAGTTDAKRSRSELRDALPSRIAYVFERIAHYAGYIWPLKGFLFLAFISGLVAAAFSGLGIPLMIYKIFPAVFDPASMPAPIYNFLAAHVAPERLDTVVLLTACLAMPLVFCVRGFAMWVNAIAVNYFGLRVLETIRTDVFVYLQKLPLAFHERQRSGDILSRIVSDAQNVQTMITQTSSDIIKQPLTALCAITALVYVLWSKAESLMSIASIVFVCVAFVPIFIFGRRIVKRARSAQKNIGEMTAIVQENLAAQREIRAYGMEREQIGRLLGASGRFRRAQLKMLKYRQAMSPILEILTAFVLAFVLVRGRLIGMTLTDFMAVAGALFFACDAIRRAAISYNKINQAYPSLERLEMILTEPDTMPDPKFPRELPPGDAAATVEFRDVSFSYAPAAGTTDGSATGTTVPTAPETNEFGATNKAGNAGLAALSHVNVSVPAGQVVALVGPSGAGKTTFAALIERFYDVTSGSVRVGGIDVRELRKSDLRRNISLVSQHAVLFRATIRENIRLGRPDATDEEVAAAAHAADVDEFLKNKPRGIDTPLGDVGSGVSGGQRQRIAIARALLKNAPILILDEATASLDAESEKQIQDNLAKLVRGKTAFIVAHRFSSVRIASRILVFSRGRIVGDGTHDELYASCPLYKSLYDKQGIGGNDKR